MKRFASHYLYLPSCGFLKQYVVEFGMNDYIAALYPLKEEVESTSWVSGVIILLPQVFLDEKVENEKSTGWLKDIFDSNNMLNELPDEYNKRSLISSKLLPFRLYPFDYERMQPKENTTIQPLK